MMGLNNHDLVPNMGLNPWKFRTLPQTFYLNLWVAWVNGVYGEEREKGGS